MAVSCGRPSPGVDDSGNPSSPVGTTPPGSATTADPATFALALAELVDVITERSQGQSGQESSSAEIGDAVATLITGAEHADITLIADSQQLASMAALEDRPALLVAAAQSATGEGPGVDAARSGRPVVVQDLHTDTRWPQLAARAPRQIRSILCTPLTVGRKTVGVLTALSTRARAFHGTSTNLAAAVAAHAATAFAHAEQLRDLHVMAQSRDVIGQAKGILMQRCKITAEQAFQLLSRASQNSNITIRTLSEHLANTGQIPTASDYPNTRRPSVRTRRPTDAARVPTTADPPMAHRQPPVPDSAGRRT